MLLLLFQNKKSGRFCYDSSRFLLDGFVSNALTIHHLHFRHRYYYFHHQYHRHVMVLSSTLNTLPGRVVVEGLLELVGNYNTVSG